MRWVGILAIGWVLGGAATAHAQITADQAKTLADTQKSSLPPSTFSGELGFGQIREDFFFNLTLRLNMDWEWIGFGVQAPLRLKVWDREPKQDDWGGFIRREDWDQVSDFFRIIRYFYVGQWNKKGPYYVRLGELTNTTVGHGTIMHRYYNTLDADRWHLGFNGALNIWAIGAEVVLNDVTDPWVIGTRAYVRPLQIILGGKTKTSTTGEEDKNEDANKDDSEGSYWDNLHVGFSLFGDYKAPYLIERDPVTGVLATDDDGVPKVSAKRPLLIYGVDVGFEVLETDILSITPYIDLNKISRVDNGWGFHAGVLWELHVPLGIDNFNVDLRTEYRRVSGDYLGPYFNTVYEIERYQRLTFGPFPVPKLYSLECNTVSFDQPCNTTSPGGRHGLFFDLVAGLPKFVLVGGEYIDYYGSSQPDGSLRLSLEVPAFDFFKFSAFYYRVNIDGPKDLFKLDDRSAIVAQATIPIYWIFSVNLRYFRLWQPNGEGGFDAIHEWEATVGFSLEI